MHTPTREVVSYLPKVLAAVLVLYIVISNLGLFNVNIKLHSQDLTQISSIGPTSRVAHGQDSTGTFTIIKDRLTYFYSASRLSGATAKVNIKFKSSDSKQQILLGYQDQALWHFTSKVLSAPFIDGLKWKKVGTSPYLYQKEAIYKSTTDFLKNPPVNKVIGLFDYNNPELTDANTTIPDYKPSNTPTVITTPLRGSTTFYVYLDGEPFHLSLTKQDLNWYSDPDVMTVSVYKGEDRVLQTSIGDDGDSSQDHKVGPPQVLQVNNPGPGLPEPGVYKVVIDASPDIVITHLETNLHKIVFEGPLYPVSNHEVYGSAIAPTTVPTTLFTDANKVSVETDHQALQSIEVGGDTIQLGTPNQTIFSKSLPANAAATMPLSDVVLNGVGYFYFKQEQYFRPSIYKTLEINNATDLSQVDYVLTQYPGAPKKEGGWSIASRSFNLSGAVSRQGKISWLISVPGLKDNDHTVEVKSIDMTLTQKGWFSR